jgi:carboxylesterase
MIIPTAEPFFLPGRIAKSPVGCLLIHGFTGAPKEMRWMGEYLAQQGFSVLGVRLAGHATCLQDMIRMRYTDWMVSVEDGFYLLSGTSQRIFLIGLSMGGILSLLMSTHLPVAGVIAMATPYRLPLDYPLWFIQLASLFLRFQPKTKEAPDAGWYDKEAFSQHVSYPQNPMRSGVELKKLVTNMQAALPQVSVPVLLVHSRDDTTVPPDDMSRIYAQLGTSDKAMLWVEGGGHVITEEPTRQRVFEAASGFIHRVTGVTR